MRIAIDTDSRKVLTWQGVALESIDVVRRDRFPLEVKMIFGASAKELPADATGAFAIKVPGMFASGAIASASAWAKTGTGSSAIYTFDVNLNTSGMATLFTGEPASVNLVLEVAWTYTGVRLTSVPLPVVVANDYIRGDEGSPVA
jgi:hypothetical protein